MSMLRQVLLSVLVWTTGTAWAMPVNFQVSPVAFTPGAGYGVDALELNGTLLDVAFSANTGLQQFALANAGDSASFNFGSIRLQESGVLGNDETDALGVSASFLFLDPLLGLGSVTATGSAVFGFFNDVAVDFSLQWDPLLVLFADGGAFRVELNNQFFNQAGQSRDVTATVTLLRLPSEVPEPATLALAGLALCGLLARRHRPR